MRIFTVLRNFISAIHVFVLVYTVTDIHMDVILYNLYLCVFIAIY